MTARRSRTGRVVLHGRRGRRLRGDARARPRRSAATRSRRRRVIVERLAELVAGRDDVEFANLESEHAMFG